MQRDHEAPEGIAAEGVRQHQRLQDEQEGLTRGDHERAGPEEREAAPDRRVRHPMLPGAHDPELPGEAAEGEGDARENGAAQEGVEEIREEEHRISETG